MAPDVNIEQLLARLKDKGVPLPNEIGAYLALEVCEGIQRRPVTITTADVWILQDGAVEVRAEGPTADDAVACRSVISFLGQTLVAAAPGVPQMLLDLVEKGPSGGKWQLALLRDDLEASLVPLNRGATRRVLARLLREANREGSRVSVAAVDREPSEGQLDAELDALVGVEPGTVPPARPPAAGTAPAGAFGGGLPKPPVGGASQAESSPPAGLPAAPAADGDEKIEPPEATGGRLGQRGPRLEVDGLEADAAPRKGGSRVGLVFILLAAALAAAYAGLGRDRIRELLGMPAVPDPLSELPQTAPAPPEPPPKADPSHGELSVSSSPAHAQVMLFVGRAPVDVKNLPVGTAHEFIAIADDRQPARAVVASDATWRQDAGTLIYELAIQTDNQEIAMEWDFGPTRLPRDLGAPSARLGTIRVITTPPGAKVYQLIGFTPDVRVQNLPSAQPIELLVYEAGYKTSTVVVSATDWVKKDGKLSADLDIALEPNTKN